MQRECFTVKYIARNNCFAYLPDTWLFKSESKENAIEVSHNKTSYYLSCDSRPAHENALCISTTFARHLNISNGDKVLVSSVKDVPSLTSIKVIPRSTDDREILELQMDRVQSSLLNQIRIVARGQPIVIWISKFSTVTLITESLEPNFVYGKLEQFTEVHVLDRTTESDGKRVIHKQGRTKPEKSYLDEFLRKILQPTDKNKDLDTQNMEEKHRKIEREKLLRSYCDRSKPRVYRVNPLPKIKFFSESNVFELNLNCPFHIFVPRKHAPKALIHEGVSLCELKKVQEDRQHVDGASSTSFLRANDSFYPKSPSELIVKAFLLEETLAGCSKSFLNENYFLLDSIHPTVYVSESVTSSLKLKSGSRVVLRSSKASEKVLPSTLEIFPLKKTIEVQTFKEYVKTRCSDHDGFLLNSNATLVLDDGCHCIPRFSSEDCAFGIIDRSNLDNLKIRLKPVLDKTDSSSLDNSVDKEGSYEQRLYVRHLSEVFSECQITLDLSLGLRIPREDEYDRENILISGAAGSGKTTVWKLLRDELRKAPYFVHTHAIDCKSLKGKKAEMMRKIIVAALTECAYHQPSVLFLDDLENITSVSTGSIEENTPDAINAARITDMLVNVVTQYQQMHYISIVATCSGINKIGQRLRPARGVHFFKLVLSIPNLEKMDRIDILKLLLEHATPDMEWDHYGNKTEGWMVQDLVDLSEKATFSAWKRHAKERCELPVSITREDMVDALERFTPMSMHGVKLYKGSGCAWSDIGGLKVVKTSLIEILHWPLKYPEIFKNAPIKLQNGVLLYGMPGTGKTLLAKAIANECGVNLISVKGPELLSKYIGVSEESVRNVFERALRAKPCVLFFDEFDSLAPRRGHDSTGVTDRVVNQLLTQLDGVEDREGIAVVAATSRPDLLDPALLRPGRLDKALHCPLPNLEDREEILAALCKSQNIDIDSLDLKELADLSSGFTGADLNAVVTQAKLSALEDIVNDASGGKIDANDITVTQKHLVESAKSTRPSLSVDEMLKYGRIYARFSKDGNFVDEIVKNQKSTLA